MSDDDIIRVIILCAVAFVMGGLLSAVIATSAIRGSTLSKEVDHDLGIVCYWTVKNDISCVPLNQTNHEEERDER